MISRINILTLTLIGLFGFFDTTMAQTDTTSTQADTIVQIDTTKISSGLFLIMPIEFPIINTQDINQQLTANGFPKAIYPTANFGIGFQIHIDRVNATFSFVKTTKRSNNDTYLAEVEYRSTSFNVGYSLIKSPWFSVYPYLGFKGTRLHYLYREKEPQPTTLDDYLKSNLTYKTITNSRAHLDLGIGLSHQWFYLVNFRFGYLVPLGKVKWNINNNKTELTNSPSINYNFYFTATIGLGFVDSDKKFGKKRL